jgi:hypothetical protein
LVELKERDEAVWLASNSGKFNSAATWDILRKKRNEVAWWPLLWFLLNIPRHSFIGWLAINYRLSMNDRMMKWGFSKDIFCCFCRGSIEVRSHLFFPFSFLK